METNQTTLIAVDGSFCPGANAHLKAKVEVRVWLVGRLRPRALTALLAYALYALSLPSCFPQSPTPDSFNPGANGSVGAFAPQPDGKILVAVSFSTLRRQTRNHIGRLNANGILDSGFNLGGAGNRQSSSHPHRVNRKGKSLQPLPAVSSEYSE